MGETVRETYWECGHTHTHIDEQNTTRPTHTTPRTVNTLFASPDVPSRESRRSAQISVTAGRRMGFPLLPRLVGRGVVGLLGTACAGTCVPPREGATLSD